MLTLICSSRYLGLGNSTRSFFSSLCNFVLKLNCFFCIRNLYRVNRYLLFVLFMRLFIILVLVQIDAWRHLHLHILMLGISNFWYLPLLFAVNSGLDFLSQIESWCFPLKLKYVLMLRQSVALGWSLVQLKKSFFFASTSLRSSILLTDLPSLYWFLIIYTNRGFRELCSQFLESCSFTWCEFSVIVCNVSQDFKLFFGLRPVHFRKDSTNSQKPHSCHSSFNLT